MTYNPNAGWTTAVGSRDQAPVFYLELDGVTTRYATAAVRSPSATTKAYMDLPTGGGSTIDVLGGRYSTQTIELTVVDVDDELTGLIATEAAGATVSTMINRAATLYAGDRELLDSSYAPIWSGKVSGVELLGGTAYRFSLSSSLSKLAGNILENAAATEPTTLRGNPINLYYSLLADSFLTTGDFPLDSVSTYSAGVSSAPTGLGIAVGEINTAQLIAERDRWFPNTVVELVETSSKVAAQYLAAELFRGFQCFPAIDNVGDIGLRFLLPALPLSAVREIDESEIVQVTGWRRRYDLHLNKFTYLGDHNTSTDTFDTTFTVPATSEDTTNQTATGEIIEYKLESRWLRSAYDGDGEAISLANRLRIRYRATPAEVTLSLDARGANIEQGDVVSVTHSLIPDLLTGSMGITSRLMVVEHLRVDWEKGLVRLRMIDAGWTRYSVIAPTATPVYTSASDLEKAAFGFVGATGTNEVGSGDPGYVVI